MPLHKWDWACFVSYRHEPSDTVYMDFITEFKKSLFSYISMELASEAGSVFRDRDVLIAGDEMDPTIAGHLCNSLTLVPIYVQRYFSNDRVACIREFEGMLRLERERISKQDNPNIRLIIPVVLTEAYMPPYFASHWCILFPFHLYRMAAGNKRKKQAMINEAAHKTLANVRRVFEAMSKANSDPCETCGNFELITAQAARDWFEQNRAQYTYTPEFPR